MSTNSPSLIELFLSFLRLGATAFGGPSMVSYIRKMAIEQKGWLEVGEFNTGAAFCQVIPGATAMQMAAYVGLSLRGVAGAAASFIGFGLPAFLLMSSFAVIYARSGNLPAVVAVFNGLQAIVVAIVANAAWSFGKTTINDWQSAGIVLAASALLWGNVSPLLVIILAAASGWLLLTSSDKSKLTTKQASSIPFEQKTIMGLLVLVILVFIWLFFLMPDFFRLAILMVKVDLMAFGGGFASVPVMYHDVVEVNQWMSAQTFMNGIVLGQATPGPIVITATFVGYLLKGIGGALVATISIFLPSFVLVIALAPYLNRFSTSPLFQKIIRGVLCSFVGLLISVSIRFAFKVEWDALHILLASGALLGLLRKVDILWIVVLGAVLSIWLVR